MFANTDVEENWLPKDGASEGIRTLDTHVGNVMLYQAELRSLPRLVKITGIGGECKSVFPAEDLPADHAEHAEESNRSPFPCDLRDLRANLPRVTAPRRT